MKLPIKLSSIFLVVFFAQSCVFQPPPPQPSQLELREFQTRSYDNRGAITAMKAMINALQDEGFIIKNADKDLGFIQATKEVDIGNFFDGFALDVLGSGGNNARWQKSRVTDCSANLTTVGKVVKVRVIFQEKILDNLGGIAEVSQLKDPKYYQNFFTKVDKSLFIEQQGL